MKERRFIEENLPIEEISREASREKSIRQGHLSTVHIWWGRKPLMACRGAILASILPYPKEGKEIERIESLIRDTCKWKVTANSPEMRKAKGIVESARKTEKPLRLLDCFSGGGSIPLESATLGLDTYSLELNPVGIMIQYASVLYPKKYGMESPNLGDISHGKPASKINRSLYEDVKKWGNYIYDKVSERLGEFFPKDADGNIPLAYYWARTVKCPNPKCNFTIPLVSQTWLENSDKESTAFRIITDSSGRDPQFELLHGKRVTPSVTKGTVLRGSVLCPACNNATDPDYVSREALAGRMGQIPIATISSDPHGRKIYKLFSKKDADAYKKAVEELRKTEKARTKPNDLTLVPSEPLPPIGTLGFRVQRYGYKVWGDFFNDRQKLVLATISKTIQASYKEILGTVKDPDYAKAIALYLAMALDRLADYDSNLCIWVPQGGFIAHTFTHGQAVPPRWEYVECNPFSHYTGAWLSALEWILLFIKREVSSQSSKIDIRQGTATNLPFPDRSFDIVVTDPPYYDAISYSNLADFFYVWLKRSIGDLFPELLLRTPLSPKREEVIQEPVRFGGDDKKASKYFENQLLKAFSEINRVMCDDGLLVLMFTHKSTVAWEALLKSLLDAKFVPTASWPLHTERTGRLRARKSAAIESTIFLVCRKRLSEETGYFDEIKEKLREEIEKDLARFWEQDIKGADFLISAIGPAVEVFGKYKRVTRLSGEELTASTFLDTIREIVTDYSLRRILHESHLGSIDEITRFYVLWRWAYNNLDIEFDDARKLAQALGAEAGELINRLDILQKKGEKVRLLGPKERSRIKDLGETKGELSPSMIDVIHRSCLLWEKGDKNALQEYLSASGYAENELIWNVVQALSDILPEGEKEKQLMQGLLAAKTSFSGVPRRKQQRTLPSFTEEKQ